MTACDGTMFGDREPCIQRGGRMSPQVEEMSCENNSPNQRELGMFEDFKVSRKRKRSRQRKKVNLQRRSETRHEEPCKRARGAFE